MDKLSYQQRTLLRRSVSRAIRSISQKIEDTKSPEAINAIIEAEENVETQRRNLEESIYAAQQVADEVLGRNIKI